MNFINEHYNAISKTHLLFVGLFLISMIIKAILIFKSNESFDNYRAKTKFPEMAVTIIFLILGIFMIIAKDGKFHFLFWIKLGAVIAAIPLGIIGAKKHNKGILIASVVLFLGAYGLSEAAKKRSANIEIAEDTKPSELGKELFNAQCASCHGEDGKKGLAGAADLSTSLDQLTISNAIVNGKGNMPPMPNISSDTTNLNAVIKYVQTLKK